MTDSSTTAPPSDPPSPRRRRVWPARLLPFVPIVLALSAAFAYHSYEISQIPVAPELGAFAPDFSLHDNHEQPDAPLVTLSRLVKKGPVMILFHRGLGCGHCYSFLRAVADQIDDYNRAGMQIVAVSSDTSPAADDSEFPFRLLYDPDDQLALTYGLLDVDDTLNYGIFIVDRNRIVRFVSRTMEPMDDVPVLVEEAQKLQHP